MAKITYDDKEIYVDGTTNSQYFRYQDANEIKNVVNTNDTNLERVDTRLEHLYELLSQETTQTGTELTINNTFADNMQLDLKGNESQNSTTGKNIVDCYNYSTRLRGLTITTNADGTFNITGRSTSTGDITLSNDFKDRFEVGKTYAEYLSSEYGAGLNIYCALKYSGQTNTVNITPNESRTISATALESASLKLYVTNVGVDYDYHNLKIMIGEGSTLTEDDYEAPTNGISPNPQYPQQIEIATGNNTITITNSDNTASQILPVNLGSIELCKIGDYQDYIYKDLTTNKWYKHKTIEKIVLNGTETNIQPNTAVDRFNISIQNVKYGSVASPNAISTHYTSRFSPTNNSIYVSGSISMISIMDNRFSSLAGYKTWLSANNVTIYYVLNTATDVEITDTTLIEQLEAINNAQSYDYQTNITQTNAILPFIITATARVERS